jgi:hypothetical protein
MNHCIVLVHKKISKYCSGAVGGKTGKNAVLPGFCEIEGSSSGVLPYYDSLTWPVRARCASGAAGYFNKLFFLKNEI